MTDTNVLLSAILYPGGRAAGALKFAVRAGHTICLCAFIIDEMRLVVKRKFPGKEHALEQFLAEFSYELLPSPAVPPQNLPSIRDDKDLPILASAILGDVDVLLTGDKDFDAVDIKRPVILTPAKFMQLYE